MSIDERPSKSPQMRYPEYVRKLPLQKSALKPFRHGHQTSKEVARYTRAARQGLLADTAMSRISADEKANKSVPLDESVTESGTITKAKGFK